jgi:hypothetical protein
MRPQRSGIGAFTLSHSIPASPPEQSKEPAPGLSDMHAGSGSGERHAPPIEPLGAVSKVPGGQTPPSGVIAMQP